MDSKNIRNIAIIAHVDHGKTTLVDALLRQSEGFGVKVEQTGLLMDSNELEKERGITIFSKNASIQYKGCKINIVDTPGHADFGGEVERIMFMVQGALLLVDAKDGPMPQTKFVLKKALEAGHRIIVVINKIDIPNARPEWVLNKTFDLFVELGATERQADFPVLYSAATQGKAGLSADLASLKNVEPLFEAIIQEIPAPTVKEGPAQMPVVNLFYDSYKGQVAVGLLVRGTLKANQQVVQIQHDGSLVPFKVTSVSVFKGMERVGAEEVFAGDIVALTGMTGAKIGETIADAESPEALPFVKIEEPTVQMLFGVNTSPFSGKEGEYSTARNLKERLEREMLNDVALRVELMGGTDSSFIVSGRGELHLAILIEKMRREGFELQVGKPKVILKEESGTKLEPFENVYIECPEAFSGTVIEKMGSRKGILEDMKTEQGVTFLSFSVPTRGLIGYRTEFMADTKGQGIMNTLFHGYKPFVGEIKTIQHGSLVAYESGITNSYGLLNAQNRGQLFLGHGVEVYEGMIVGKNAKPEDLEVNVCKTKQLSNMRSKGEGVSEHFDTPLTLTLEESIEYLGDDELLEVTPKSLRLRKMVLPKLLRKRAKMV
ncbi:MAG: GTP-binding protein TypA [Candidatus Wildermuthbacteria bacterium RIFCSPHIGHO2_01_FULL_48_25]|uniref:50S ribosomal subunit assembly factor BipA n=1 Tax=Candidatus Wildermuthbacteria bacterium RIFCSPLOWO2_01_FULL_48_16 TaxID=1802461 RepID=A0A1G2RK47_9BACT|nr:MAG: GTP-binding protein TypA [Candidatus Wildermuthbacteria bacterium RIFCSPHIGHO2_01_FULL_48_25]OHA68498.1 MAG: GTP-binding protein TypA [Candidatus Wildermuthbacteria bacterium RIFCSPHIGHO2_02_FULL_49_12b]OHA72739.1 MAG: GTP-binding protein TypA [Candidatus Wildermuthbacteria bacterium RIFCSPLOWO2_01_FULL_48_16]